MTARKASSAPLTAYVLHSWDWSETSLIVELFTRERGRLVVVAKGAKRPYSQLRAVLMPFQRLSVQLGRAPADESAEVHLLRHAERAAGPPMPPAAALFAGFYLNELLLKLIARQDPHALLFDRYAATVESLHESDEASVQTALRVFELGLLRELGVLPALHQVTLAVAPVQGGLRYTLHAESGVVAVPAAEPGIEGQVLVAIEAALGSGDVPALADAVASALSALRGPLRELLHYHLGSPMLRTRQVMTDVRKLIEREAQRP